MFSIRPALLLLLATSACTPAIPYPGENQSMQFPSITGAPPVVMLGYAEQGPACHTMAADIDDNADRAFLQQMIPHHVLALRMAEAELRDGHDPFARQLAQNITIEQKREIAYMRGLLKTHAFFATEPGTGAVFQHQMHMMHGAMMGQAGETDLVFIRGMIPHHQAAVAMARTILEKGRDPKVRQLALDIINAQQGEISQMYSWLNHR